MRRTIHNSVCLFFLTIIFVCLFVWTSVSARQISRLQRSGTRSLLRPSSLARNASTRASASWRIVGKVAAQRSKRSKLYQTQLGRKLALLMHVDNNYSFLTVEWTVAIQSEIGGKVGRETGALCRPLEQLNHNRVHGTCQKIEDIDVLHCWSEHDL